jgi:2-dehydro-3-deoxyglucarate aldolase
MEQQRDFRERIEQDKPVIGARSSTFSPTVVEIYGDMGFDFVWLDYEHMGPTLWDGQRLADLCRSAENSGIDLLVRTPLDTDLIRKSLDAGVRNLLIPRVDGAEEVRTAVEASRFDYDGAPGERGYASWRASGYGTVSNYPDREDESVCVGVMLEKTTAFEALDEILAVPDLGFVFVGPGDLSTQMGYPGEKSHPEVQDAIAEIERKATRADVPLGCVAHDPETATDAIDDGYQVIRLGGELEAARETLRSRLRTVGHTSLD